MDHVTQDGLLDGLIGPDEVARELGVHRRTLDRWHLLRIGPPRTELGKRVFYRREAVAAWIRDQERPHSPAGRRPAGIAHGNRNSRHHSKGGVRHA